jgi:tetratricopeptide (TPR) repeat protein
MTLLELGRPAESIVLMREAATLEPTSPWVLAVLSVVYEAAAQHDSAYAVAERGYGIDSTNWVANAVFSGAKFQAGDTTEGIRLLEASLRLGGERHSLTVGRLGEVYARVGRRADAERIAAELAKRVRRGEASRFDLARVHAALGDRETAFYWLKQPPGPAGSEELVMDVPELESDPRYKSLVRHTCLKP